jgi:type III pantothenate kinase
MTDLNLIIDVGNTKAKVAVAHEGRLLTVEQHEQITPETLKPLLEQYRITSAIYSSVRAGSQEEWITWLGNQVATLIHFTHTTAVPVKNLYRTPESLGCDRLAAAVGAHTLFPDTDCMIIDCGTAITIDFLSRDGAFLGGNISPGLQTRFNALHTFTGKLPLKQVTADIPPTIGTNTDMAITAGVLQGTCYEIEGYMRKNPQYRTIFTGGDAFFFVRNIKSPIFVVCNLVLIGLNRIVNYNV